MALTQRRVARWRARVRITGGLLGLSGALISALAYTIYGTHVLRWEPQTNIITWALWSLEAVLSFRIYKKQVADDLATYAEELVASLGCCTITALLLARAVTAGANPFGPVEWVDGVSALLFAVVFGVYRHSLKLGDVWPATLAFQGVMIFSAFPLVRSTLENPWGEPLWPWVLWTAGFALQFLCAFLRQDGARGYRTLLTPLNYLFWHALIAGIVYMNAVR
jgi:hypothetical protein